jgi:hypothetical protein
LELDKLEGKDTFIQQAIDIFNPSPENQWVYSFYGKNAADKVQISKWTKNSKTKGYVNCHNLDCHSKNWKPIVPLSSSGQQMLCVLHVVI